MCIRDSRMIGLPYPKLMNSNADVDMAAALIMCSAEKAQSCLLYTSDAADERSSVDLGGRRIIKKQKSTQSLSIHCT